VSRSRRSGARDHDASGPPRLGRCAGIALVRTLLIAAVALCVTAPSAGATPTKKLSDDLGALWTTVLQTPSAQNSFGTGGQDFACWNLDGTVAPFAPFPVDECTVTAGTRIFIAASSIECSTFEGNGTTDDELRRCARESDLRSAPPVTLDGRPLQISEVETALLHIVLPADNLFGLRDGTEGLSVGHGWVALVQRLDTGTHTIVITLPSLTITTKIVVTAG
jgi:hypothetical protein